VVVDERAAGGQLLTPLQRPPPRLPAAQWRLDRAANCDTLISRLNQLATADPPLPLKPARHQEAGRGTITGRQPCL
jgi:hypothetical protein